MHNSASPWEQDKLRHFQGHRGPSHAKGSIHQSTTHCSTSQPSPGIVFSGQLRFIVQMVSKLYLGEVKNKLNQTRLLGFRRAHFLFQESAFQHSELLLLQTIFPGQLWMPSPNKNLIYKMKRKTGELQTSANDVKGATLNTSNKFPKVHYFNLLSSKYYWNF